MDEPRPADENAASGPDPEAVASLRALLPERLAHLPVTSAAEFRQEAWRAWYTPLTANGSYHPRIGFRGVGAMTTGFLTLGGLWMLLTNPPTQRSALEVAITMVVLVGVTALLTWSKWRSNRKVDRLEEGNKVLSALSKRIDQEVEAGRIPLTPPGWEDTIFPPL